MQAVLEQLVVVEIVPLATYQYITKACARMEQPDLMDVKTDHLKAVKAIAVMEYIYPLSNGLECSYIDPIPIAIGTDPNQVVIGLEGVHFKRQGTGHLHKGDLAGCVGAMHIHIPKLLRIQNGSGGFD